MFSFFFFSQKRKKKKVFSFLNPNFLQNIFTFNPINIPFVSLHQCLCYPRTFFFFFFFFKNMKPRTFSSYLYSLKLACKIEEKYLETNGCHIFPPSHLFLYHRKNKISSFMQNFFLIFL